MDLPLNLGHALARAGEYAAELPDHALLRDSINRDDAGERAEWQEHGSRGRRMRHGELPSNFVEITFISAATEGHGEEPIFF